MSAAPVLVQPQCPHCGTPLTRDWIRTGNIQCPYCTRPFHATAFDPPQRRTRAAAGIESFPEGANACAIHAGNAAVTTCQRCGLLICSLCDMNLGEGSYCPGCFDRVHAEGELRGAATRYPDHAAMATISALAGILFAIMFLGIPIGGLAVYYARKGMRQRRREGQSVRGMIVVMILGILEILSGFALIAFFIWSAYKGASS